MTTPNANMPTVKVRTSALCRDTIKKYSKDKRILNGFYDFVKWKRENPLQPYRSRDYKFTAGFLKGIPHATLNHDVCVVYELSGTAPHILTIHGMFSHDELGTGNPARPRLQSKARDAFDNPRRIQALTSVDESSRFSLLKELLVLSERSPQAI